jgi:hypothetical protein
MVTEGDLPNESYRIVTRFGVSAAAIPATSRKMIAKMRSEMWPFTGSSLA